MPSESFSKLFRASWNNSGFAPASFWTTVLSIWVGNPSIFDNAALATTNWLAPLTLRSNLIPYFCWNFARMSNAVISLSKSTLFVFI